jgi:hypothetical protein
MPTDGGWRVGSTDRAYAVHLGPALELRGRAARDLPVGGEHCAAVRSGGLSVEPTACSHASPTAQPDLTPPTDAASVSTLAAAEATRPDGTTESIVARVDHGARAATLELTASTGARRTLRVEDAGAALLLADLDGDGQTELVSSRATRDPAEDALRVDSLGGGPPVRVATLPAPGLSALAACPFLGKNPLLLVAAVGRELWVLE